MGKTATRQSKLVARERSPVQTRARVRQGQQLAFAQLTACEPEQPERKLRVPKLEHQLPLRRSSKPICGLRYSDHIETRGKFLTVLADTDIETEEEFFPQTFKRWKSGILRQQRHGGSEIHRVAPADGERCRVGIGQTTAETKKQYKYDPSRELD